ncbi:hypothetical protein PSPO01_08662 [Paraphaeosphaeria sporulosa]
MSCHGSASSVPLWPYKKPANPSRLHLASNMTGASVAQSRRGSLQWAEPCYQTACLDTLDDSMSFGVTLVLDRKSRHAIFAPSWSVPQSATLAALSSRLASARISTSSEDPSWDWHGVTEHGCSLTSKLPIPGCASGEAPAYRRASTWSAPLSSAHGRAGACNFAPVVLARRAKNKNLAVPLLGVGQSALEDERLPSDMAPPLDALSP